MQVAEDLIGTPEDAERIGRGMSDAQWALEGPRNADAWTDADPEARLEMDWTLRVVDQLIAGDRDTRDHSVHSQQGFSMYDGYLIPLDDEEAGIMVQSAHDVKHAADFLETFVGDDGPLDRHVGLLRARYDEEQLRAGRATLRRTVGFYVRARDRQMAVVKYCAVG
ncbi:hypothetical protein GCM10010413_09470 [Promicromonospora sukumoe]